MIMLCLLFTYEYVNCVCAVPYENYVFVVPYENTVCVVPYENFVCVVYLCEFCVCCSL